MPPKNYKSVSVSDETYDKLHRIAAEWEEALQVQLSVGATITRLVTLYEQQNKGEVSYTEK